MPSRSSWSFGGGHSTQSTSEPVFSETGFLPVSEHSAGGKLGREARLEVDPEGFGVGGKRTLEVRELG